VIGTASRLPDPRADTRVARLGAIAWPSFFAAGVATLVFFAMIDPVELAEIAWPHIPVPRDFGYTIGFFMFWAATFAASAFTALLLRPPAGTRQ
jgi:hypothetical protein